MSQILAEVLLICTLVIVFLILLGLTLRFFFVVFAGKSPLLIITYAALVFAVTCIIFGYIVDALHSTGLY